MQAGINSNGYQCFGSGQGSKTKQMLRNDVLRALALMVFVCRGEGPAMARFRLRIWFWVNCFSFTSGLYCVEGKIWIFVLFIGMTIQMGIPCSLWRVVLLWPLETEKDHPPLKEVNCLNITLYARI